MGGRERAREISVWKTKTVKNLVMPMNTGRCAIHTAKPRIFGPCACEVVWVIGEPQILDPDSCYANIPLTHLNSAKI